MAKVTDTVAQLALPYVEAAGCTLWDVEYIKEAGEWYLRIYIDKEGGVSIEDCEAVSRPLSDKLDELGIVHTTFYDVGQLYLRGLLCRMRPRSAHGGTLFRLHGTGGRGQALPPPGRPQGVRGLFAGL